MKQIEVPDTPLMQQYQALKNSYPHAVLFFRLGDFYEMFYEDARTASSVLGIALTSRQGAPMCGIPYHSHTSYVSRLLDAGYKVAICEQISQGEDEKTKLKKREVVRLLTPGTLIEEDFLETKRSNHLLAVHIDIVGWAAACIEVSTGEFFATQNLNDPHYYHLRSFVSKTSPSEIIIDSKDLDELKKRGILFPKTAITAYSPDAPERSEQGGIVRNRCRELCERPEQEPDWVQQSIWQNHKPAMKACLHIISYVRETQPGIKQIFSPVYFEPSNKLQMDESAVKTLELTDSEDNTGKASLWEILDNARTPMGSRLLKKWILEPLTDIYEITRRQDFVSFLAENPGPRETLGDLLCQIPDIERILGRIANSSAAPRDASSIRRAIYQIPRLKSVLGQGSFFEFSPEIAGKLDSVSGTLGGLRAVLEKALVENPPARISDGGVIKEGYNAELDELRNTRKNSRKTLIDLEAAEKQKTGIPSLKVGFNNNFGYYIEITKAHLHKVPHYYTRKQTLVNAERFITQELKEIESKVLGAEERIIKLETSIFQEIRDLLLQNLKELKIFAMCVSELDAFYSLAVSAVKYEYSRPEITTGNELYIEEGRHPIVEKNLPGGAFVPNNLSLGAENSTIILTGPNMSGKSVYLRQNALLVIMAQMGSFVPAKSARIGITDRIMTRIGAHDRLALGESTFMVEMKETASILNLVSSKSLVLLDEVGRGTSTFDGISIAWAVTEYLCTRKPGTKALFATHYFELTELAEKFPEIKNFNVAVKEWTNTLGKTEVVFLHKILPGPADKSYGIHVAHLAGLPDACIQRSKEILAELEARNYIEIKTDGDFEEPMLPMFSSHPVLEEIKRIDVDNLTPINALNAITEWKKRLNG